MEVEPAGEAEGRGDLDRDVEGDTNASEPAMMMDVSWRLPALCLYHFCLYVFLSQVVLRCRFKP